MYQCTCNYISFVWKRDRHFAIYFGPRFDLEFSFLSVITTILLRSRTGIRFRHYFF